MKDFTRAGRDLISAFFSILVCAGAIPVPNALAQSDKRQVLIQARQKYYNVRQAGLVELQANIEPNWQVVVGQSGTPGHASSLLNALHFSMSIDSASKLRLDHYADIKPTDKKVADDFDNIFKYMDQAVSRFLACWSVFMLTSPFSQVDSDYELAEVGDQYRLSRKEGLTTVITTVGRDFRISEIKVLGSSFTASLKPILETTKMGFVLGGYSGSYETASSNTLVEVRLEYQKVAGLRLPRKVFVDTVYEGKPAQLEWVFTDYKVKVR